MRDAGEKADTGGRVIDHYVAELDKALAGPRAAKADLLTEVRDGLTDAAEAYEVAGLDRTSAERQAVRDFGPVPVIAPGYQAELGLSQGRRTALLICVVMLVQPVAWWALGHLATGLSIGRADPGYLAVDVVVRWAGGGAIVLGLAAVLATGSGVRFLGVRRQVARLTGLFAFAVCAVFSVLGVLLTWLSTSPGMLLSPVGLPGTLVLLGLPLAGIGASGRRCLRAA